MEKTQSEYNVIILPTSHVLAVKKVGMFFSSALCVTWTGEQIEKTIIMKLTAGAAFFGAAFFPTARVAMPGAVKALADAKTRARITAKDFIFISVFLSVL